MRLVSISVRRAFASRSRTPRRATKLSVEETQTIRDWLEDFIEDQLEVSDESNPRLRGPKMLTYIALQCIGLVMKLDKELVAASSVPLVLSILSENDSYGYAIIQRVRELSGGKIEWTDGMLYPVLHWLEDHGFVRSRWMESGSGRKRKYYSLQHDGRQALRQQKQQWSVVTSALNQLWGTQHA